MRLPCLAASSILLLCATGCHSAYVEATIRNQTTQPITLVEVDYPSASFGTQTLAPNQDFHYRFKILGSGNLKFIYTDAAHAEHNAVGPSLAEGDEGTLLVSLDPAGVHWASTFKVRSSGK